MIAVKHEVRNTAQTLDRDAWRRIRRKARQLVGKAGFRPADREDIEQELALRLWRGLGRFDPTVGCSGAFATTVLERAANSLLRLRSSRKRGNGHVHQSLMVKSEDPEVENAAAASTTILCDTSDSHEYAVDLVHDVAVVLDQLPAGLRKLAETLKRHSVAEIARRAGVSRSTVYAQIAALRAAFAAAERKNLSPSSDTSRAFCEVNK